MAAAAANVRPLAADGCGAACRGSQPQREKMAEASAAVSAGGGENVPEASDILPGSSGVKPRRSNISRRSTAALHTATGGAVCVLLVRINKAGLACFAEVAQLLARAHKQGPALLRGPITLMKSQKRPLLGPKLNH